MLIHCVHLHVGGSTIWRYQSAVMAGHSFTFCTLLFHMLSCQRHISAWPLSIFVCVCVCFSHFQLSLLYLLKKISCTINEKPFCGSFFGNSNGFSGMNFSVCWMYNMKFHDLYLPRKLLISEHDVFYWMKPYFAEIRRHKKDQLPSDSFASFCYLFITTKRQKIKRESLFLAWKCKWIRR